MTTYLLELGVEEFPSRYMASTKQQLKQNVLDGLASAGLSFSDARVEATPRRFALWLEEVKAKESEGEEVVRGPSKQAAFDAEGQPTKALLGFLRAKGLQLEDTFVEDNGKNEYVFARLKRRSPWKRRCRRLLPRQCVKFPILVPCAGAERICVFFVPFAGWFLYWTIRCFLSI